MPAPSNLTGKHFGRWHVLGPAGRNRHRQRLWSVKCACGTRTVKSTTDLKSSLSCGCYRAELLVERNRTLAARNRSLPRQAREKEPRVCDRPGCGVVYRPLRRRSRYCSDECRSLARSARISSDPALRAAHARYENERHKEATWIDHPACAHCQQPFRGPPSRKHCSPQCLEAVIRSGKYRTAFQRRKADAELAALTAELERRMKS